MINKTHLDGDNIEVTLDAILGRTTFSKECVGEWLDAFEKCDSPLRIANLGELCFSDDCRYYMVKRAMECGEDVMTYEGMIDRGDTMPFKTLADVVSKDMINDSARSVWLTALLSHMTVPLIKTKLPKFFYLSDNNWKNPQFSVETSKVCLSLTQSERENLICRWSDVMETGSILVRADYDSDGLVLQCCLWGRFMDHIVGRGKSSVEYETHYVSAADLHYFGSSLKTSFDALVHLLSKDYRVVVNTEYLGEAFFGSGQGKFCVVGTQQEIDSVRELFLGMNFEWPLEERVLSTEEDMEYGVAQTGVALSGGLVRERDNFYQYSNVIHLLIPLVLGCVSKQWIPVIGSNDARGAVRDGEELLGILDTLNCYACGQTKNGDYIIITDYGFVSVDSLDSPTTAAYLTWHELAYSCDMDVDVEKKTLDRTDYEEFFGGYSLIVLPSGKTALEPPFAYMLTKLRCELENNYLGGVLDKTKIFFNYCEREGMCNRCEMAWIYYTWNKMKNYYELPLHYNFNTAGEYKNISMFDVGMVLGEALNNLSNVQILTAPLLSGKCQRVAVEDMNMCDDLIYILPDEGLWNGNTLWCH